MTAGLEALKAAATPTPLQLQRDARQATWTAARAALPPRPAGADWPATRHSPDWVLGLLSRPPFTLGNPGSQRGRLRGAMMAIAWLGGQPGSTWQQRWLASGAEAAGAGWKHGCAGWLDSRGMHARQRLELLSIGLILAICADTIRPSLDWLSASGISSWALARNLERSRGPAGFARLRAASDGTHIAVGAQHAVLGRAAIIVAAKGGTLAEVTAGDFLELLDAERRARGRAGDYSAVSWRLLHQAGVFGPRAPASLAQLLTIGQRSPAELIDRYQLACRPVRDLLVEYLQERQPAGWRMPRSTVSHMTSRKTLSTSAAFWHLASYSAGRLWVSASGPASQVLRWFGRRVGGLGPGLTRYSADAARLSLESICRPGPGFWHPPALPV